MEISEKISDGLGSKFSKPIGWREIKYSSCTVSQKDDIRISENEITYVDKDGKRHGVMEYQEYVVEKNYDDHDAGLCGEYRTTKIGSTLLY